MSRRKQAKPQHIGTDRPPAETLQNGQNGVDPLCTYTPGELQVCGNCHGEFVVGPELEYHQRTCKKKQVVMLLDPYMETNKEIEENTSTTTSLDETMDIPKSDLDKDKVIPHSNVSLTNLENTSVAVAQYVPTPITLPKAHDVNAIQEQLYALQQQHVQQLQLIQQIQQQIQTLAANQQKINNSVPVTSQEFTRPMPTILPGSHPTQIPIHMLSPPSSTPNTVHHPPNFETSHLPRMPGPHSNILPPTSFALPQRPPFEILQAQAAMPTGSIPQSPLYAASMLMHRKGKPPNVSVFDHKFTSDDPFFRHKCHWCHKVFGSDSALQIHVRSHTGERPFKCNICGNRFTTKGNLKVHFQRHKVRYPDAEMDCTPYPPSPPPSQENEQAPFQSAENQSSPSETPNGVNKFSSLPMESSSPQDQSLSPGLSQSETDTHPGEMHHCKPVDTEERSATKSDLESPTPTPTPSVLSEEQSAPSPGISEKMPYMNGLPPTSVPCIPMPFSAVPMNSPFAPLYMQMDSVPPSLKSLTEQNIRASETSKLQQLVENIEQKITDPNQCVICHRVLSCKSALHMHYRIHTGERPYKCNICSRAFTSKGNLKTHYGVHRAKPPSDLFHECSVCGKSFGSASILQKHMQNHPDAADIPQDLTLYQSKDEFQDEGMITEVQSNPEHFSEMDTETMENERPASEPLVQEHRMIDYSEGTQNGIADLNDIRDEINQESDMSTEAEEQLEEKEMSSPTPSTPLTPPIQDDLNDESQTDCNGALDLTPKPQFNETPAASEAASSTPSSPGSQSINIGSAFTEKQIADIYLAGPGRRASGANTTCGACGKVFACSSALNIHMRSHTKERPFRCGLCEKGFSTRGNLKQHMLTHKIRDLPSQIFDASHQPLYGESRMMSKELIRMTEPVMITGPIQALQAQQALHAQHAFQAQQALQAQQQQAWTRSPSPDSQQQASQQIPTSISQPLAEDNSGKRTLSNGSANSESPPKRPAYKHACNTCGKQFQSDSALQIHIRTHTGEKPFKCHICGRAFTTKGNLKVHMGTHMWNGSTSRRGRRLSLDPPMIMSPKEGEVFRSDLMSFQPAYDGAFFQYPPFMNGVGVPKPNEISVIQNHSTQAYIPPQLSGAVVKSEADIQRLQNHSTQAYIPTQHTGGVMKPDSEIQPQILSSNAS
ncbi:sal-like protein 3 [Anneissia japonica]|uniref:sal-like protein 3 n=1 Tax=Anneissia japonica TaxID=1529436 RepID=UPI001425870E|nr:sal-like protein 3 [Anneissia japonica]